MSLQVVWQVGIASDRQTTFTRHLLENRVRSSSCIIGLMLETLVSVGLMTALTCYIIYPLLICSFRAAIKQLLDQPVVVSVAADAATYTSATKSLLSWKPKPTFADTYFTLQIIIFVKLKTNEINLLHNLQTYKNKEYYTTATNKQYILYFPVWIKRLKSVNEFT